MNRRHFVTASAAAVFSLATHAAGSKAGLRVAVIGHTGQGNFGHGLDLMWSLLPETEVVAVADANAQGLAAVREKLRVPAGFSDYRQMLAQTRPDIVAVGPRHIHEHRDMALAAVEAGARGIYIEKPFCRTPAEADEIVAACARRQVRLAVAHRNRYHPVLPVLRKLIAAGDIGRVLEIRARGKEDHRGGALDLWVLGSHLLNLAAYFAGEAVACSSIILRAGRPVTRIDLEEGDEGVGPLAGDEIHARFETAGGVPVFFDSIKDAGLASAGLGLRIIGTRGVIEVRIDEEPLAYLRTGNPFEPRKQLRDWVAVSSAGVGQPEPISDLGRMMAGHVIPGRDLIAALRENREPLCSARDGAATIEMISAVFESHRLAGRRVTLPLATRQNPLSLL